MVVCILIFILVGYVMVVGLLNLSFLDVLKMFIGRGDERMKLIVFNIRFVWVLVVILVGIGFVIGGSVI